MQTYLYLSIWANQMFPGNMVRKTGSVFWGVKVRLLKLKCESCEACWLEYYVRGMFHGHYWTKKLYLEVSSLMVGTLILLEVFKKKKPQTSSKRRFGKASLTLSFISGSNLNRLRNVLTVIKSCADKFKWSLPFIRKIVKPSARITPEPRWWL